MCDLETLKAITSLSFTTDNIQDLIHQLSTFGVMTLGPVIASARLAKYEVVGPEKLTEWTGANGVHGTRLEIDQHGTGNIFVGGRLKNRKYNSDVRDSLE